MREKIHGKRLSHRCSVTSSMAAISCLAEPRLPVLPFSWLHGVSSIVVLWHTGSTINTQWRDHRSSFNTWGFPKRTARGRPQRHRHFTTVLAAAAVYPAETATAPSA